MEKAEEIHAGLIREPQEMLQDSSDEENAAALSPSAAPETETASFQKAESENGQNPQPAPAEKKLKISAVLAAYNGAGYIEEQLDSIAGQSHPIDELLIRDDQSTDDTSRVIDEWIAAHPDFPARRLEAETNLGYIGNFSTLIEAATGDWIFLSDQDDRWHPDKVEKMLQAASRLPDARLIASSFEFMNQNGEVYYLPLNEGWSNQNLIPWKVENPKGINVVTKDQMLQHNYFQGCAMMIRKELGEDYNSRHDFHLPHDWFLALLASSTGGLYYLDLPLFDYRIHHHNTTGLPQARRETKLVRLRRRYNRYYRTAVIRDMENVYSTIQRSIPEINTPEIQESLEFCQEYLKRIDEKNVENFRRLKEMPGYSRCITDAEFAVAENYVKLSRIIKFPDKKI